MSLFSIFRKPYVVERPQWGNYAAGRWIDVEPNYYIALFSIQPRQNEQGRMNEFNPEGTRLDEDFWLYTSVTPQVVEKKRGDILIFNGKRYQLYQAQNWQNELINHFKVRAVIIGDDFTDFADVRITASGDLRLTTLEDIRIVGV